MSTDVSKGTKIEDDEGTTPSTDANKVTKIEEDEEVEGTTPSTDASKETKIEENEEDEGTTPSTDASKVTKIEEDEGTKTFHNKTTQCQTTVTAIKENSVTEIDSIEQEYQDESSQGQPTTNETVSSATRNEIDESMELLLKELDNFAKITQAKTNPHKIQGT